MLNLDAQHQGKVDVPKVALTWMLFVASVRSIYWTSGVGSASLEKMHRKTGQRNGFTAVR